MDNTTSTQLNDYTNKEEMVIMFTVNEYDNCKQDDTAVMYCLCKQPYDSKW